MYSTNDAWNEGQDVWHNGGFGNPYNKDETPKCYAAWKAGAFNRANPYPNEMEAETDD